MSDPVAPQTNTGGGSAPTNGADIEQYGDQSILIGLPAEVKTLIPGMGILELKKDREPQWTVEVPGQGGNVAAFGKAKKKKFSGTGSGILLDKTDFEAVEDFEFEGDTYIITKHGEGYNYKDAVKADFTFIGYEGVAKP